MKCKLLLIFFTILAVNSNNVHAETNEGTKSEKYTSKTFFSKNGIKRNLETFEFTVKSEAGRMNLSNYKVIFAGEKKNFRAVEVYSITDKQKSLTDLSTIQISDLQNPNTPGIIDTKIAYIPINNIKVGSLVHIEYEITSEPEIQDIASEVLSIANNTLAKEETYTFESELPMLYTEIGFGKFYKSTYTSQANRHVLEIKPTLDAYAMEGKEIAVGQIYLTTAQSWEDVNKRLSPEYKKVWNSPPPPEIQKIITAAKKLKSTKEKIEYASREISGLIAYSGTWTTRQGKMIPQNYAQLMATKRGDCKDYSSLLVNVLRNLNITAFPALISRSFGYPGIEKLKQISKIPAPIFNHAIVYAKDENQKTWWVDPTNPLVVADVISADILGNYALILDETGKDVSFLPEQNTIVAEDLIEQTIFVKPGLIDAKGKYTPNILSYNSIGQLEKQSGLESIKPMLNLIINPQAKLEMSLTKSATTPVPSYSFSYVSNTMLEENKKFKALHIPNALLLNQMRLRRNQDVYVGEIGTLKIITTIKNSTTIDTYQADCTVRTPWYDMDRFVENKNNNIVVTDTYRTKKRNLLKEETVGDAFDYSLSEYNCGSRITLSEDETLKDKKEKEIESSLGPDVYKMTAADFDKLLAVEDNPEISTLKGKKLLKYYNLKLAANPNDPAMLRYKGSRTFKMGWVHSNYYQKAYAEEALTLLLKAKELYGGKYDEAVMFTLFSVHVSLKLYQEAASDLKIITANSKEKYSIYQMSAKLAAAQGAWDLADRWTIASGKYAKTPAEENSFNNAMIDILVRQKKFNEALTYHDKIIAKNPNNAWLYHNKALVYYDMQDWDKVIELEKKAISISSFGAAKHSISNAYYQKATLAQFKKGDRQPAYFEPLKTGKYHVDNIEDFEAFLLESVKWNSANIYALSKLTEFHIVSFLGHKRPEDKAKAKYYIEAMVAADPTDNRTIMATQVAVQVFRD